MGRHATQLNTGSIRGMFGIKVIMYPRWRRILGWEKQSSAVAAAQLEGIEDRLEYHTGKAEDAATRSETDVLHLIAVCTTCGLGLHLRSFGIVWYCFQDPAISVQRDDMLLIILLRTLNLFCWSVSSHTLLPHSTS